MNPKSRTNRSLEIIYDGVVNKDYDEVLCICGDEGKGKTHIGLHIIDWWLKKRYGDITPDMAGKYIGMDAKGFSRVLRGVKRFDPAMDDEAADISSRSALEKTNKLFMKAYQIIRGDNLLTILIIPSLWDLDPFFRKRRVKHLIHVYKRGHFAFWSGSRLKKMVERNEKYPVKNYYVTRPLFFDRLGKYDGELLTPYLKMKEEKMAKVRELLNQELEEDNAHFIKEAKTIKRLKDKFGLPNTELAGFFGVSDVTIGKRLALLQSNSKDEVEL